MLTVRVPGWLLEQACLTHASNWSSVQPCIDAGMAPWRAGAAMELADDLSTGALSASNVGIFLPAGCGSKWVVRHQLDHQVVQFLTVHAT